MNRGNWKWFRLETILNNNDIKKASWFNNIISLDRQYKVKNYVKNETFTFLNMNWGKWKWFRLQTILNNNDIKKASWFNHIISLDRQYKDRNNVNNETFTLLNMNWGNWKWFRLKTILNKNDMKKASWFNLIISLDRQYKVRNYVKNISFTLLKMNRANWKWFRIETILNNNDIKKASWFNNIISLDRKYKVRNYVKNETFTLLNMNWGNWKWFRLITILNKNDMKKASWFNLIISLDRQYKVRNYVKNISFTLLKMNRANWKWFMLQTILNNNDIKKASWFNHIISLGRQYKDRNNVNNETFTLLNMNWGNWKWFRLKTILNKNDMKKASWFNLIISLDRQYKVRNYVKNISFTLLKMNRANWKWFMLQTILNNNDIKKASWFNNIISMDRKYKVRNYVKNETFTLLNMNRGNWKWFMLQTILNNTDIKKASWFNHIISLDRQNKPKNYL